MGDAERTARRMLESLAAALNTINLYPDPNGKPPFERALATLGELADDTLAVEVSPDSFQLDGQVVSKGHAAVANLAQALFLQDVGSFALIRPPSGEELIRFREELFLAGEGPRTGDFQTRLDMAQVKCFRARDRSTLVAADPGAAAQPDTWESRHPDVRNVLQLGSEPERLAEMLVNQSGNDAAAFAETFTSKMEATFEKIEADDWAAREKATQAFVEAFFYLPNDLRMATLEACLDLRDGNLFQNFLDQFASNELEQLAPHLSASTFTLLLEYARVVADEEQTHGTDLEAILQGSADLGQAKDAIMLRVGQRLNEVRRSAASAGEAVSNLRPEVDRLDLGLSNGVAVLRGLVQVENRGFRVRRLMRIWAGKVSAAIAEGRFEDAFIWVDGVGEDIAQLGAEGTGFDDAFALIATPEILAILTTDLDGDASSPKRRLLGSLGRHAADPLIEILGEEKDLKRRRALIAALAEMAKLDPGPISAHLDDPRWYVVRNLAMVLGRAGRAHAGPALIGLLRHSDSRVRVEALRSLVATLGPDSIEQVAASLRDPEERVRGTAANLLSAMKTPAAKSRIAALLVRGDLDPEVTVELLASLESDSSDTAEEALRAVAKRRGRAHRLARAAAKEALKERRNRVRR